MLRIMRLKDSQLHLPFSAKISILQGTMLMHYIDTHAHSLPASGIVIDIPHNCFGGPDTSIVQYTEHP